jgi:hypothetical protein
MRDTIEMAREAGVYKDCDWRYGMKAEGDSLKAFADLVRADERMSFYGQDKPAECADGCPPNQICDYCQVVAPAKAMILAEREVCAKVCEAEAEMFKSCADGANDGRYDWKEDGARDCANAIRARGNT